MNKYLIELLKLKSSVILPGIGTLMVANKTTGKVVLNPHLKFDDGALANFIADKEKIDTTEAKNQVAKFIREIEAQLNKGESYDIFQFGKLYQNEKGENQFEMEESVSSQVATDSSKASTPPPAPKPTVTETPKAVTEKKEEPKEVVKTTDDIQKQSVKEEEKKETAEVKNVYIPPKTSTDTKKTDSPTPAKVEKPKESQKKEVVSTTAMNSDVKKQDTNGEKEVKEKKKRKIWPIFLILLLLGGLGGGGFFYKEKLMAMFNHSETSESHLDSTAVSHDKSKEDISTNEISDTLNNHTDTLLTNQTNIESNKEITNETVEEIVEKVEEVIEEKPVVTTKPSDPNGSFHIVGGGFSEKSNAENYVNEMSSKGYSPQILGRFDGLYLVTLKSFNSRSDAQSQLNQVNADQDGAWIFKYPK